MSNNFEVKVKYVKVLEDGKEKKVTEPYLFDAVSFTDAETKAYKEFEKIIHSDFIITNISRSNISEIVPNKNGDRWFKSKVRYITVDEESGKEKKSNNYMLVEANNVDNAYAVLTEYLSDMIVPFEIPSVSESPIVDIFEHDHNNYIPEDLTPINNKSGEFDSQGAEILDGDILEDEFHNQWYIHKKDDVFLITELLFAEDESEPKTDVLKDFLENSGLELIRTN